MIFVVIDRTCGGVAVLPGCTLEFVLSCLVAPVFKYKCSSAVLVQWGLEVILLRAGTITMLNFLNRRN